MLSRLAAPCGVVHQCAVDLQPGMVIALQCRERWFPWGVLQLPVAVALTPLVRVSLARLGSGWPRVGRLFVAEEEVLLVPRHHGVCMRCGGLSPCADELVERSLQAWNAFAAWPHSLSAPTAEPESGQR